MNRALGVLSPVGARMCESTRRAAGKLIMVRDIQGVQDLPLRHHQLCERSIDNVLAPHRLAEPVRLAGRWGDLA